MPAAATGGRGVTYGGRRVGGGGALGGDGGAGEARAGAFTLAEVPLALTNQRLLVALHPLQLLLRGHPSPGRSARRLQAFSRRGQELQGTLRSLLLRTGENDTLRLSSSHTSPRVGSSLMLA